MRLRKNDNEFSEPFLREVCVAVELIWAEEFYYFIKIALIQDIRDYCVNERMYKRKLCALRDWIFHCSDAA